MDLHRVRRVGLVLAVTVLAPIAVAPAGLAAAGAAPSRYRQVFSRYFPAPAHGQGYGRVTCPSGTRVAGGGVFASFADSSQIVAASYPSDDGRSWLARFTNTLGNDSAFRVIAVCLAGVRDYAIVRGHTVSAAPGADRPAVAAAGCPLGTAILAGGAATDAATPQVALAAEAPARDLTGWRAYYTNRSRVSVPAVAYAICGHRLPGYQLLTGAPVTVPAHRTATAVAVCAPGLVVLGSGGFPVGGPNTRVDVNTVFVEGPPVGEVYLNNRLSTAIDIVAVSLCAAVG